MKSGNCVFERECGKDISSLQQTLFYWLAVWWYAYRIHCNNPLQSNLYPLEYYCLQHVECIFNSPWRGRLIKAMTYSFMLNMDIFLANAFFQGHASSLHMKWLTLQLLQALQWTSLSFSESLLYEKNEIQFDISLAPE